MASARGRAACCATCSVRVSLTILGSIGNGRRAGKRTGDPGMRWRRGEDPATYAVVVLRSVGGGALLRTRRRRAGWIPSRVCEGTDAIGRERGKTTNGSTDSRIGTGSYRPYWNRSTDAVGVSAKIRASAQRHSERAVLRGSL